MQHILYIYIDIREVESWKWTFVKGWIPNLETIIFRICQQIKPSSHIQTMDLCTANDVKESVNVEADVFIYAWDG